MASAVEGSAVAESSNPNRQPWGVLDSVSSSDPYWLNPIAFCCVIVGSLAMASGCASITSKFPELPGVRSAQTRSAEGMQPRKPLANPEDQLLQIALETARLAEERSMDAEAIAAYEKVRRLDPDQPGVAHALAVLYDRAAKTDAAHREYVAALAESPEDADVLCDYGYFLHCTGKIEEAEKMLRRGLAIDSNHRQSIINLAVVLATQRKYDESKSLFEKAIGPAAALHNIGMFKLRQDEATEGQQLIATAQQQDPSIAQAEAVLKHVSTSSASPHIADSQELLQR